MTRGRPLPDPSRDCDPSLIRNYVTVGFTLFVDGNMFGAARIPGWGWAAPNDIREHAGTAVSGLFRRLACGRKGLFRVQKRPPSLQIPPGRTMLLSCSPQRSYSFDSVFSSWPLPGNPG